MASGSNRGHRDAAAYAMQGMPSQFILNNGEVSDSIIEDENTNSIENSLDKVKERSQDQRLALPGDPKCVICGRYGEYICDETDDDICSLECKESLLQRVGKSQSGSLPPNRLLANDECYYVNSNEDIRESESLTDEQTALLRKKLDIVVKGDSIPAPIFWFSSCKLPQKLLQNIEAAGYEMPTPVQMQAIPAALTGKSLLVSADTGTGKTASFLIPIISNCASRRHLEKVDVKKPLAIVLEPTRELSIQVEEQAKLLGKGLPFKTALVVGGDAMAGQIHRIQQGVELIVGTPGRLLDLLTKHDIELDDVLFFVLDEVDCMLQRGFRDQVMQIFRALSNPQLLMYSATISHDVERMSRTMAKNMSIVSVGKPNIPNKAVKQIAIWVETKHKKQKLFDILSSKQHFLPPVVVYVSSRVGADLLANAITVTTGMRALSIHGEKPMKERREIMKSFLMGEGDSPVIVTTGLLDRGVNLLTVKQVIVFDMPNSVKEYVHQIGRASRLGEEGTAIVFVNEENKNLFPEFIEVLKSSGAPVPRELQNSKYATWSVSRNKGYRKRKHGN